MSANNLVTSKYLTRLRTHAAADGTPIRKGKERACSSVSTTATTPGDQTPGCSTAVSVISADDCPFTPGKSGLDVSIDRFRELGIVRGMAHCPLDVLLCWKICCMMGLVNNVPDLFVMMLYRSVKLLHRCGYHTQDIVTVASYAVAYTVETLAKHLGSMDWKEAANMFGLQLYLAHAYLMDEHCPLKEWHKHIFAQYCNLNVLSTASVQLMRSRGFIMRIEPQKFQHVYRELLTAVHTYRWNPTILHPPLPLDDEDA